MLFSISWCSHIWLCDISWHPRNSYCRLTLPSICAYLPIARSIRVQNICFNNAWPIYMYPYSNLPRPSLHYDIMHSSDISFHFLIFFTSEFIKKVFYKRFKGMSTSRTYVWSIVFENFIFHYPCLNFSLSNWYCGQQQCFLVSHWSSFQNNYYNCIKNKWTVTLL